MSLLYSIDTSSLVAAWYERYPHDLFPSFWKQLETLIHGGKAKCVDEVREELTKKNDELFDWTIGMRGLFHPLTVEVQMATSRILSHPEHQKLTNTVKGRGRADPFVIALAKVSGASVVTEERSAPTKMKIPDVCAALDVRCISLLQLMRDEQWSFA